MQRGIALRFAGLLVGVILAGTWIVKEHHASLVVRGASMAPTLLGTHRLAHCSNCNHQFAVGEELLPDPPRARCPLCYKWADLASVPPLPGDRLTINSDADAISKPERWDLIVFTMFDPLEIEAVKRVVGLPGEAIELRDGDVYADGKIVRKNLPLLLSLAILVHDTAHEGHAAPRWLAETPEHWRGLHHSNPAQAASARQAPSTPPVDWLVYHHRQAQAHGDETRPGPILDDLAYNASESRLLEPVGDVLLRARLRMIGDRGALWLRASDGRETFRVRLDPATQQAVVFAGAEPATSDAPVARFAVPQFATSKTHEIVLALADGQLLLSIDGAPEVRYEYVPSPSEREVPAAPLAVGAEELELRIERLEVLRDVHYLATPANKPEQNGPSTPRLLAEDEYFVLGDNSSISVDSRVWPAESGLRRRQITGKIIPLPR